MEELLREEYIKIKNNDVSSSARANIINNIIQIKLKEKTFKNYHQNISLDIKDYLNAIINQAESASIGYDSIQKHNIENILEEFTLNEKLYYINFFIRQLQKNCFEEEISKFQSLRTRTIIKHVISKKNILKCKSLWLFLIHFPQYNIFTLIFTFLLIGTSIILILLPAPFDFMQWLNFEIIYQNVSKNNFLNHVLNVFSSLVGIESDFKIIPKNEFSMFLYILSKIIAFLYVANYLFNKLVDFIKTK
ncbi:hypothetical protein [Flavobacterium oreochromis]|uniref:Uncharacterized protein n=1 Tax=Flavobacterium oreochromis TaxID=2906078 RepID=A0ABW8P871_9FLAO|nr:hypothetical protein [Flavobacterium oreochromis]OWP78536.1 hypothetical protein BWG23_01875 [Flavobacterium oreochromis]